MFRISRSPDLIFVSIPYSGRLYSLSKEELSVRVDFFLLRRNSCSWKLRCLNWFVQVWCSNKNLVVLFTDTSYHLAVKTGEMALAGTDANVFFHPRELTRRRRTFVMAKFSKRRAKHLNKARNISLTYITPPNARSSSRRRAAELMNNVAGE
jgi:hypothetical protein